MPTPAPKPANGPTGVAASSVVRFPTCPAVLARLHANGVAVNDSKFWQDLWSGHAVAVNTGHPAVDALWVRDTATWALAATQWSDLQIRIVGELFLVPPVGQL